LNSPTLPEGSAGLPNRHLTAPHSSAGQALGQIEPLWAALFAIALTTRALAASFLPNAEQDGYSYAEIIARLSQHLQTGQLHVSDLYGFWLPLFQVTAAALNLGIHDPLIAGKIVNAFCGATVAILVFDITRSLTSSRLFSIVAFTMILVDPLHLLYSAACMTDVPHSCLVLASVWFALRRRWLGAAVFGALAGCIRIESWALLAALPMLQFLSDRRVSVWSVAILILPPLAWLCITYAATGHPLTYFHERARYHAEYMNFHPGRHGFHMAAISQDIAYFLLGAGKVATAGAMAAAAIVLSEWLHTRKAIDRLLLAPMVYYAALLGLIVLAYMTKAQPVLLPRYGLTFLAIGLPLFAWTLQWLLARVKSRWLYPGLVLTVAIAVATEIHKKLPTVWKVRDDFGAHEKIALILVNQVNKFPRVRIFSDDVAVRVLSHLPPDRFVRSASVQPAAATRPEDFITYLRNQNARFLVYFPTEDSLPVKLLPELGSKEAASNLPFEKISYAPSTFGPDIWLYELH
jgi:hypothetical protein